MNRKPVREWMILLTYLFLLIIITVHSGYICRKIYFTARQFLPLICAGGLSFVLNHPYKYIQCFYEKRLKLPKKVSRTASLITVYAGTLGIAAAVVRFALPHFVEGIQNFFENRETYMQAFENSAVRLLKKTGIRKKDLSPLMESLSVYLGYLSVTMEGLWPRMIQMTTGIFRKLAVTGIVIVLSAYILYNKEVLVRQIKRLYRACMPQRIYQPLKYVLMTALEVSDNFIVGQGLESIILGSLCFAGMFVLNLEYSGFVGLIVGLTAFIPFFGAYIGGGTGFFLLMFISVEKAIVFLVFFIILQQIENNFIYPRVVGKRIGLPALWVLSAVTIGGGLFGVIGMILGVPVATFFYVLIKEEVRKREKLWTNIKK